MLRTLKNILASLAVLGGLFAITCAPCQAATFAFKNVAFVSGTIPGSSFTTDALTGVSMPNNVLLEMQVAQYATSANVKLFRFNYIDGTGLSLSSGSGKVLAIQSGNALTAQFGVSYKASTDIATVSVSNQQGVWTVNLVVASNKGVPYFTRQGLLNPGYAVQF